MIGRYPMDRGAVVLAISSWLQHMLIYIIADGVFHKGLHMLTVIYLNNIPDYTAAQEQLDNLSGENGRRRLRQVMNRLKLCTELSE
jgi:hypothetical protein